MIRDPWIHDEMEKNKKAEWKKNEKVFEKENLRWIEYDPHIISRDHHHRIFPFNIITIIVISFIHSLFYLRLL